MKKKFRDLTVDEVARICKIHLCKDCPFYKGDEELYEHGLCFLDYPSCIPGWMLNKEVEVPDELIEYTFEASHTSKEACDDLFTYMKEHGFIYSRLT